MQDKTPRLSGGVNLNSGLQAAAQQMGRKEYAPAEQTLRRLLKSFPNQDNCVHLLGIAVAEQGRLEEGLELLRKSVRLSPSNAEYRTNLAAICHNHGRKDQALLEYRRAIQTNPRLPAPHANLGILLLEKREYAEAEQVLRQAAALAPNSPAVHNDLGVALLRQDKLEEARRQFTLALEINPRYAPSLNYLGTIFHREDEFDKAEAAYRKAVEFDPRYAKAYENLGRLLTDRKRTDEAIPVFQRALALDGASPEAHRGMANTLRQMKKHEEALAEMRRAVDLDANFVPMLIDLTRIYHDLNRFEEASAVLDRAKALEPQAPEIYASLGYMYFLQGRLEESIAVMGDAIQRAPDNHHLRADRGVSMMMLGDLERGWQEYESRLKFTNDLSIPQRNFGVPRWDGSDLNGRTILLHWEQGYGDSIQFCRYAPLVAARGGWVLLEVKRPLVRLMRSVAGVQQVIDHGEPLPPFDVSCSLMSCPAVLRTTLNTVPNQVPYLHAEPADAEAWRERLGKPDGRLRVGLVWAGATQHSMNHRRSLSLKAIEPILAVPDVAFFSLQIGGTAEIQQAAPGRIADFTSHIDDFADTAAALTHMDMVLCVDTGVGHLAGALGKPVWMMLYFPGEWRWMQARSDSPWYPSMRIFRQRQFGDWTATVNEVAEALRKYVKEL